MYRERENLQPWNRIWVFLNGLPHWLLNGVKWYVLTWFCWLAFLKHWFLPFLLGNGLKLKRLTIPSADKHVEQFKLSYFADRNVNMMYVTALVKNLAFLNKVKHIHFLDSATLFLVIYLREIKAYVHITVLFITKNQNSNIHLHVNE